MKKRYLLCFAGIFAAYCLSAQDTIKVQTFTWADTHRADTFEFPNDPAQQFRKILMIYNMRCHNAAVGNGNVGCYEWDYSCNTFITDPSRTDSTRQTAPTHVVSNFSGTSFPYSLSPTYEYTRFTTHESNLQAGVNQSEAVLSGPFVSLAPASKTFRYQVILPAADLIAAGLTTGPVYGLRLSLEQPGTTLGFLKIRLKNTAQTAAGAQPDDSTLTEVYHRLTDVSTAGDLNLPFYQVFNWTGGNLLLDISYTTNAASDAPVFRFFEAPLADAALISMPGAPDNNLYFDGSGALDVPATAFQTVQNEITVAFWSFGNAGILPANTHLLEAKDAAGRRQATLHLPWGDSQVYWDCGNDGSGFDRISKGALSDEFEGKWNHWAFTKNTATGEMKIFLNGQMWQSAGGKTRPIDIQSFRLGKSLTDENPYFGAIDEIQIWDKALDETTVKDWMFKSIDIGHPYFDRLVAYYRLNEGSGNTAASAAPQPVAAALVLPKWQQQRGSQLFHNFSTTALWPEAAFLQGDYSIEDVPVAALDSAESSLHRIVSYGLAGTTLIALDTQFVYPAGPRPVYDESGHLIDTLYNTATDTIEIGTLVHYTKRQARFELLSLVTPYGNGLDLGPKGKTFTFDVTDFAPVLKGKKRLSVEFGGENQEELDIEFWFITGTPEREVLDIQPIWPQDRGGFGAIQADQRFEPRLLPIRADAASFKIRSAITGHEQNGEFVPRQHYIDLNGGVQEFVFDVWKACGKNPIYPQGGTWVFDRAGWCPGMATDVHEFALDGLVQPGDTVQIDYGINGDDMASANYLVNNLLVSYGPYTAQTDASVEAIVRPNKDQVEFARLNPACNTPTVRVKNTGAQEIQSIEFEYQTSATQIQTYTWTGNLPRHETIDIALPTPPAGFWQAGTTFTAAITAVNGAPDGNADNNIAVTNFTAAKTFNNNSGQLQLRLITNQTGADYSYRIKDGNGALLLERNNLAGNTTYTDDLLLPSGCYTLEFDDAGNDGLSFWYFPENGSGSLRFQLKLASGAVGALYNFNPDFGAGVQFDFQRPAVVGNEEITDKLQLFSVYPNPAAESLNIDLVGFDGQELRIEMFDLTGKAVLQKELKGTLEKETLQLDIASLFPGMYVLRATDGKHSWVQEVAIGE